MAIKSIAIYGSRARNDHTQESDTDLFAITDDKNYEMLFHGATNIACYPHELAMSRATGGDLFFLHIVREAVVMYDLESHFEELKSAFKIKASYSEEILKASELGFGLLKNIELFRNYYYINKRLTWCLRTMLIALSVENGSPKFSARELASAFKDNEIELLLSTKKETGYIPEFYDKFKEKFTLYGSRSGKSIPENLHEQLNYFSQNENAMATKTIAQIIRGMDDIDYSPT